MAMAAPADTGMVERRLRDRDPLRYALPSQLALMLKNLVEHVVSALTELSATLHARYMGDGAARMSPSDLLGPPVVLSHHGSVLRRCQSSFSSSGESASTTSGASTLASSEVLESPAGSDTSERCLWPALEEHEAHCGGDAPPALGQSLRPRAAQLLAVCRHAERADSLWSDVGGGGAPLWYQSEDFARFPHDPPLSEGGVAKAAEMGRRLKRFAEEHGEDFDFVVSSPYYRCVQTAVEIVKALGCGARLVLDETLGELYGPDIMGAVEPSRSPVRSVDAAMALCEANGVTCERRTAGRAAVWPEFVRDCRGRVAGALTQRLAQGAGASFVAVTHAEGVAGALAMLPSEAQLAVSKVDHGGMFLAARSVHMAGSEGGGAIAEASSVRAPIAAGLRVAPPPACAPIDGHDRCGGRATPKAVSPPAEWSPWRLEVQGIRRSRCVRDGPAALTKRWLRAAEHCGLRAEQVQELWWSCGAHAGAGAARFELAVRPVGLSQEPAIRASPPCGANIGEGALTVNTPPFREPVVLRNISCATISGRRRDTV